MFIRNFRYLRRGVAGIVGFYLFCGFCEKFSIRTVCQWREVILNYKWQPKDDLIALLLFKIGATDDLVIKSALEIGCPTDSLKLRIKNFEYLKFGTGNMDHASEQTKDIFNKFQRLL